MALSSAHPAVSRESQNRSGRTTNPSKPEQNLRWNLKSFKAAEEVTKSANNTAPPPQLSTDTHEKISENLKVAETSALLSSAYSLQSLPLQPSRQPPFRVRFGRHQVKPSTDLNRTLITVTVLGSPGPLRFLVGIEYTVQKVVEAALKAYAREGRYPTLSLDLKQFHLHKANSNCEALDFSCEVVRLGMRHFLLCPKQGLTELAAATLPKSSSNRAPPIQQPHRSWKNIMSSLISICSH